MRADHELVTSTGIGTAQDQARSVAIIGGGASGVLTAIQLLAGSDDPGLRVTIHEASGEAGRGVAYGTTDRRHLLNVRARHMSAFRDIPSDLLDWAARTGREVDPQGFLPRMEYAAYLRDTLAERADGRLTVLAGRVHDLVQDANGFTVHSTGGTTEATDVVLAYGNPAPPPLSAGGEPLPDAPWHLPDPWRLDALGVLGDDAQVVIVGTGLTAVDTAITVLDDQPGRRVVMVSRQGLLPRGHVDQNSTAWVSPVPTGHLTADRLAALLSEQIEAARSQGVGWRAVVDGLRAPTQSFWLRLDLTERRTFLERYARQWEIRRHRMAPEVAARLASYRREGRLRVLGGGLQRVTPTGAGCRVQVGETSLSAQAIVNCTGPTTDLRRTSDPLLQTLCQRGTIAPDPLALGLDCTASGEVRDADGQIVPGLFAVGPPRKGTLYESTAVPEIRTQAAELATLLSTAVRRN
ncbi:Oxidoreductase, pyridine nucleotide-disulfide family [metagenome]|uniref:Oxidoreductase, pyridine nucleotide-disulfide family n=1 Tax=metagenome TaxID=256318 RepID=A0A2P2CFU2_9ZZZZ